MKVNIFYLHSNKKTFSQINKYLDTVVDEDNGDANCSWHPQNDLQRPGEKRLRQLEIREKNQDHPDNSAVEINENTLQSPGRTCCHSDFSENHQLKLVSKIALRKWDGNING